MSDGATETLSSPTVLLRVLEFLKDLTHPEGYGHEVPLEIRARAKSLATELQDIL